MQNLENEELDKYKHFLNSQLRNDLYKLRNLQESLEKKLND